MSILRSGDIIPQSCTVIDAVPHRYVYENTMQIIVALHWDSVVSQS